MIENQKRSWVTLIGQVLAMLAFAERVRHLDLAEPSAPADDSEIESPGHHPHLVLHLPDPRSLRYLYFEPLPPSWDSELVHRGPHHDSQVPPAPRTAEPAPQEAGHDRHPATSTP